MSRRIAARLAAAAVLALAPAMPAITVLASGPVVGLSASSLDFGPVAWQQSSAVQTVTVTNTGDSSLAISTIDLTGEPYVPEDFRSPLQGCFFKTLAPGAQCQNQVVFQPQSGGPRSSTMLIFDNAPGSPQQVTLAGTGTGAVIDFFPDFLDFGTVQAGATSPPMTFTTVNAGDAPVTISSAALGPVPGNSPWFTLTQNGCTGATLSPGGRCMISATVAPTAVAGGFQSVIFTDNAGTGRQTYGKVFTGLSVNGGGPLLAQANPGPDFNNIPVGATSPVSRLQVFDGGTQPLSISGVSLDNAAAGFTIVGQSCSGTTLLVNAQSTAPATCYVDLTFTPPAAGQSIANLVFQDNELSGSHNLPLSGRGYAPAGVPAPSAIDFGFVPSGTTSTSQVVTLINPTPLPLTISSVTLTGASPNSFKITSDGCSNTAVAAGGRCAVAVAIAPPFPYLFTSTLSFSDNTASSPPVPQTVTLRGEGTSPTFTISSDELSFGSQKAFTPSAPQTITVTNTSSSASNYGFLSNLGINASGCTGSIAAGASCTVTVTVSPTSLGAQSPVFKVVDSPFGNQQVVEVDFTGITGQLFLEGQLASASIVQQVGTSATTSAVIRNGGLASLNIGQITLANNPPAAITTDNCSNHSIAPGTNCLLVVTSTPTVVGGYFFNILVPNDSLFGSSPAQFFIRGLAGPAPQPVFFPAAVSFSSQLVGAAETTQVVWLDNGVVAAGGATPLSITSVALSGPNASAFRVVWDGCTGLSIEGAFSCPLEVGFDPNTGGVLNASLLYTDSAAGSPQAVSLNGTGLAPAALLSPQHVDFGSVTVKSKSAPATVTLTSSGTLSLNIGKLTISGQNKDDYMITSDSCQNQSLSPTATCTVVIVFRPQATGPSSATLTFNDSAPDSPQTVSLAGTGVSR